MTSRRNEIVGDRYRIVDHLGEGGMGTVMIAEHVELGRRVALKVLQEKIGDDPTMKKRFQREARTLAAMSHPNIVALNDYGVWHGAPYLVMELLEGRTLRDLLDAEKTLSLDRALVIIQQVLRALGYAHAQGVIHRDLKPGNVFLQALPDEVDHVKLLDFGFAKFVNSASTSGITADGMLVGTPAYMAAEQATTGAVDHRVDIYAAGVLLFEMLCGRRPFEGPAIDLLRSRLKDDAPSMHDVRPDLVVAPELEAAIARALTRRPEDRWSSAAEFSAALSSLPPSALVASGTAPATNEEGASISVAISGQSATTELSSRDLMRPSEPSKERWVDRSTAPTVTARATPRARLWIALGASAAVIAGIGAWHAWPAPETIERPIAAEPPPATTPREPARAEPPVEQAAAPELPTAPTEAPSALPPDPWIEDAPPELLALRARILRAPRPSASDLRMVGSYVTHHPNDARGLVLLAHGYTKSRFISGALDRYEQAYALDPECRGDPLMLEDLIALSTSRVYAERASWLLMTAYGADALPALDAAIASARNQRAAEMLRALRDRIASS